MDFSTSLKITPKGAEEIKSRTHKLGMKKRSVLLLLDQQQSIQYIVGKSVFPQAEIMAEIHELITEQFIAAGANGAHANALPGPAAAAPGGSAGSFHLASGIIISEAKFLLVDFCVDNFGTQSQAFVDQIRACSKEGELGFCLAKIVTAAKQQCPDRLPSLLGLVAEINDTA